jgi:hypothetical protein
VRGIPYLPSIPDILYGRALITKRKTIAITLHQIKNRMLLFTEILTTNEGFRARD